MATSIDGLAINTAPAACFNADADGSPIIDDCFVVPPQHRPSPRASTYEAQHADGAYGDTLPVIDLASLNGSEAELSALISDVGRACEEWGFFQAINHGIAPTLIHNLMEGAKAFFALPLERKLEIKRTFDNALGYNDGELTRNVRDWKEIVDIATDGCLKLPADFLGDDHHTRTVFNQWPSSMPELREVCEDYILAAKKVAHTLVSLIAQSLGLPASYFEEQFTDSKTSHLRLNHYPVCPAPELAMGICGHKDVGALTILLQDDVGGLEVKRRDGVWIAVKPDPTALVINLGDLTQVYSNGKYQSVEHRVVANKNVERYSFPLFFNPAYWVNVSPISQLTDEQHPSQYRPFNWGKYIKRRMDSSFKHLGVDNLTLPNLAIN